jgi:hypothetical protein
MIANSLVNITERTDPDTNWWALNPQMKLMKPFNELFKRDTTKDKTTSSKEMWSIFFISEPDEKLNRFYRYTIEQKLDMIKSDFYPEFNENDEVILNCINEYPNACLTSLGRAFKEEKDSLIERSNLLRTTSYRFDSVAQDAKGNTVFVAGKPMIIKGNVSELETMRKNTVTVWSQYDKIEGMFYEEKANLRLYGGRSETPIEKNLMEDQVDLNELIIE